MSGIAMKYTLLTCLSVLASSFFLLTGCVEEDPCPGEPSVIYYNEPVNIKLHASDSSSLFDSLRPIEDFILTEHGDTLSYKHMSVGSDTLITFNLRRFSAVYIWESFGTVMTSNVILKYDSARADTLHFIVLPRFYEDQCNKTEYEKSEVLLNGDLIRSERASDCFLCGDTIILNLNN